MGGAQIVYYPVVLSVGYGLYLPTLVASMPCVPCEWSPAQRRRVVGSLTRRCPIVESRVTGVAAVHLAANPVLYSWVACAGV